MRLFVKTLLVVAMTIAIVVPLTLIRATISQRQRYCRRLSKASRAASRARSRFRGRCVIPGTRILGLLQFLAGTNLPSLGVAMLQSRQGDGQPEALAADGIDAVGVALIDPVNVYSKADRATKVRSPVRDPYVCGILHVRTDNAAADPPDPVLPGRAPRSQLARASSAPRSTPMPTTRGGSGVSC